MSTTEPLVFKDGRAVVPLANGNLLSVINPDRNRVISEEMLGMETLLDMAGMAGAVQAEDGNYEAAILDAREDCLPEPDDRLGPYLREPGGWIIYPNRSAEDITGYVAVIAEQEKDG